MTGRSALIRCRSCRTVNRIPAVRLHDRPKCGKCKSLLDFPHMPVVVNDRNFHNEIVDWPGHALVFFWASWCGHCPGVMIYMKDVARERAGMLKVATLNIEQEGMLARQFSVMSVPKLVMFRNGAVVDEINGGVRKYDLDVWLDRFI